MKTPQQHVEEFVKRVVPDGASEAQKTDMALAFTAGFSLGVAELLSCDADEARALTQAVASHLEDTIGDTQGPTTELSC